MPAEGKTFHRSERRQRFKNAGLVFVARAGVPDSAGQIELAQMRKARQFAQFHWMHDNGGEINGGDVEVAGRQLREVAHGLI